MNELLERINELKELQHLYRSGDLRDYDFESKIFKLEREFADQERAMEQQHDLFFGGTPFAKGTAS